MSIMSYVGHNNWTYLFRPDHRISKHVSFIKNYLLYILMQTNEIVVGILVVALFVCWFVDLYFRMKKRKKQHKEKEKEKEGEGKNSNFNIFLLYSNYGRW